jgi:hypothetical protein
MKISKDQLQHIIREALAQEGVGSWLKDKALGPYASAFSKKSKKREPLPGEDTTPLDMSGLTKYDKPGPGVMSGPRGTAKWNRMQKDPDLKSIEAAGDIGEKPEGDITSVAADIPDDPLVPACTGGLDQTEIQDLIDSGMGGALMRTATAERGPGPKPEPLLDMGNAFQETLKRWKKLIK